MKDILFRGIIPQANIRTAAADLTSTCNEAILTHNCDPISASIFCKGISAAVLSSVILNENESLNICFQYSGKLKTLLLDVKNNGIIKGLISPTSLYGTVKDENEIFGNECLVKVVKSKDGKILSSGSTTSIFADPLLDLAYYFSFSEQNETLLLAKVDLSNDPQKPIARVHAVMMQAMPDCNLELLDNFSKILSLPESQTFFKKLKFSKDNVQSFFAFLLEQQNFNTANEVYPAANPYFKCSCNNDKMGSVIRSLPIPERMEIAKKKQPIEISCQFCNKRYTISIEDCIEYWHNRK